MSFAAELQSLDNILDGQTNGATRTVSWYARVLAISTLALAPLVGAYAEEPTKPDTATSSVTLTKEEEAYLKKFEDKVKAVKIQTPAPGEGGMAGTYNVLGDKARESKRSTEAIAYYQQSIQADSGGWWPYYNLALVYGDMASNERDPKAKNAFYKECVIHGEKAIAIESEKKTTSGELENRLLIARISLFLGKVLYTMGEWKSALHHLEEAQRLNPERFDKGAAQYLTELERKCGDKK